MDINTYLININCAINIYIGSNLKQIKNFQFTIKKNITVKDIYAITSNNLNKELRKNGSTLDINDNKIYLLYNGKNLNLYNNQLITSVFKDEKAISLDLHIKMIGGNIFSSIIRSIKNIWNVFREIGKAIIALVKIIIWVFNLIKWIFIDFLNPTNLMRDFIKSIISVSKLIVISVLDVVTSLIRNSFNSLTGSLSGSVLGVDENDDANVKCYKHNDSDKIPITIIISTILLPPLGVFMEFGVSYWINIIICAMLTYFYYVPGLVYALVLLYR